MGMTRRLNQIPDPNWHPLLVVAAIGACVIAAGLVLQLLQLIVSVRQRPSTSLRASKEYQDMISDPWNGRTLEWSISSPPPSYNFATIPHVHDRDAFWMMKEKGEKIDTTSSEFEMPKNTSVGLFVAGFGFLFGFGMIWHIWWLVALGAVAIAVSIIARSFNEDIEYTLKV